MLYRTVPLEFRLVSTYFVDDNMNLVNFIVTNLIQQIFNTDEVGIMIEGNELSSVQCNQRTDTNFEVRFTLGKCKSESVKLDLLYHKQIVASLNYPILFKENFTTCSYEIYFNEISVDELPDNVAHISCGFGFEKLTQSDIGMYYIFIYIFIIYRISESTYSATSISNFKNLPNLEFDITFSGTIAPYEYKFRPRYYYNEYMYYFTEILSVNTIVGVYHPANTRFEPEEGSAIACNYRNTLNIICNDKYNNQLECNSTYFISIECENEDCDVKYIYLEDPDNDIETIKVSLTIEKAGNVVLLWEYNDSLNNIEYSGRYTLVVNPNALSKSISQAEGPQRKYPLPDPNGSQTTVFTITVYPKDGCGNPITYTSDTYNRNDFSVSLKSETTQATVSYSFAEGAIIYSFATTIEGNYTLLIYVLDEKHVDFDIELHSEHYDIRYTTITDIDCDVNDKYCGSKGVHANIPSKFSIIFYDKYHNHYQCPDPVLLVITYTSVNTQGYQIPAGGISQVNCVLYVSYDRMDNDFTKYIIF